jgi:cell division protein FtsL
MTKIKNTLGWIIFAAVIAAVLVAQVWKQNEYVELTRKGSASKIQVERLKSDIARIQLDNKNLKDYKRLERLAEKKYGLVYAGPPVLIYPEVDERE